MIQNCIEKNRTHAFLHNKPERQDYKLAAFFSFKSPMIFSKDFNLKENNLKSDCHLNGQTKDILYK